MAFHHIKNTHIAMIRWATNPFLRIVTVNFFSESLVNSLPFILVRSMNLAQLQQGDANPCTVNEKRNIMGHKLLEGWSTAAVAVVMISMVLLSGVLSGLTLGLMSIDMTRLQVLSVSRSSSQRRMANTILPVKKYPYYLLCSLLIAGVLVNEMLPIMNAKLFGDSYKALFISATLIIVFGEIIPQAVFPRYSLELGSALIWIVYLCMIICCIPAAILSATLSYTLRGYGTAQSMFSTDELVTFIELHSDDHAMGNGGPIESRAVALIRNIIQAQEKVVGDISRSIYDVYMVPRSLELSIEQQKRILSSGFSKIPVYETTTEVYEDSGLPKMKFWGYFQTKELVKVDFEFIKTVWDLRVTPMPVIDKDRPLYDVLSVFQSQNACMALVADPTREIQAEMGSTQRFYHGQYTNPRTQVEVGMGHSTLRYLQNDLMWTNHPHAVQKEIIGIVTLGDVMKALLEKEFRNSQLQHPRDSDEWRQSDEIGDAVSTLRPPGTVLGLGESLMMRTMSAETSTVISNSSSSDEGPCPLDGLDIEVPQRNRSLQSIWTPSEKHHDTGIHDIIQIDDTDSGEELEILDSAAGTGKYTLHNLGRRFSFEDGVDEKDANLLETRK